MMFGLDDAHPAWGGELRTVLARSPLGLVVGVGALGPKDTTIGGVRLRQWRVPADVSVRATVATQRVAWYGELGVVAALLGEEAVGLPTTRSGTAIELGGHVSLGARTPSGGPVSPFLVLSVDVIPDPPSISALPAREVGHTSYLWLGACLGVSWELR